MDHLIVHILAGISATYLLWYVVAPAKKTGRGCGNCKSKHSNTQPDGTTDSQPMPAESAPVSLSVKGRVLERV